jgi:hypothetical protein
LNLDFFRQLRGNSPDPTVLREARSRLAGNEAHSMSMTAVSGVEVQENV